MMVFVKLVIILDTRSPAEISAALKGLDLEALTLEEAVKQALRKMMK